MIAYTIKKQKITLLFFVMVVIIGFLSFFQLPKQEMPDIVVNVAMVTTTYPGASPEKVEHNVTNIIEEKINEIEDLKSIESTSVLGRSVIIVEANADVDPKQKWDELRKKVKDAEKDLPEDVILPVINDDLNRSFIQSFNITAPTTDDLYSLRDKMEDWKQKLKAIPNVAEVQIEGIPEKEVRIEIDFERLAAYQLSWTQVVNAIKQENEKIPLGNLDIGERTYQLKLPEKYPVHDLENVIITRTSQGFPVYLRDIGTVQLATEKAEYFAYHNGVPAISININGEIGSDVPAIQQEIDKVVNRLSKDLPEWAEVHSIFSQNERVKELFGELGREMFIAIAAVLFVCTLGLNLSSSIVVALAIPISLALGLMFLPSLNITLNQMTLVGLIIVLGILVDDAVVVNDNIERRLSSLGEPPEKAAVEGAKEVSISIITATFATIASFAPLLFLQGNVGFFIRPVPTIISLTMLASMVMSLTIVPIYRRWRETRNLLKNKIKESTEKRYAGLLGKPLLRLTNWYSKRLMPRILNHPKMTSIIGVVIGSFAYFLIPLIPIDLFPTDNRPELLVDIRMPTGHNIKATNQMVDDVTEFLLNKDEVKTVASYAGGSAPKMFMGDTSAGEGIEVGQLVVILDEAKRMPKDIELEWTEDFKKQFLGVMITPKILVTGPPVGKPVEVQVFGEDSNELRKISEQIKEQIAALSGTYNIIDSFGIDRYALDFQVNKELMDEKLVTYNDLSKTLRLVGEGITVSEFDDGKDLIDIQLYASNHKDEPQAIFDKLYVPNLAGQQVPLTELVEIKPSFEARAIVHQDLARVVFIYSDLRNRTATEVMKELKPKLEKMNLPEGYSWKIGGETSEQTDIFIDMGKLSIAVLFIIIILIAMQFYSLSLPLLVMSTVYLAFAGSLIGLFITQTPLGFMTMMGAISLSGIVVRNGIVLIEFIEHARREGMPLKEAVIGAGEARLRPILLTSSTAVAGLTPLAISHDPLFSPMAMTIISGLIFSTVLTLVLVPSLYTVLANYKEKRALKRTMKQNHGAMPVDGA
ncbi:MAG TPA: efflux RND transporter permease subunit [Bacillus bacterium]|nr:efflux RND transporter permease subunit [Bacillus sp. (in: firmicutes)]